MTDAETEMPEDNRTPMERAIAGGYQHPEEPTLKARVVALVDAMEHAAKHNAPVSVAMVAEMRDLLGMPMTRAEADAVKGA